MTKEQVLKDWSDGKLVLLGTWFSGEATTINVRDKNNGGRRDAVVARQVIMGEKDFFTVNEFCQDGVTVESWKPNVKRMDRVAVYVDQMEKLAGTISVTRCRVEKVDDWDASTPFMGKTKVSA